MANPITLLALIGAILMANGVSSRVLEMCPCKSQNSGVDDGNSGLGLFLRNIRAEPFSYRSNPQNLEGSDYRVNLPTQTLIEILKDKLNPNRATGIPAPDDYVPDEEVSEETDTVERQRYRFQRNIDPSMLQRSDPNGVSIQYRSILDGLQRYRFARNIDPSMLQRSDPNDPMTWKRDGDISIQYRSHSDGLQRYHFQRNIDPSMLQRSDPNGVSIQYRSILDGLQRYRFQRNIDPSMLQRSEPNGVSVQYRSILDGLQRYRFARNIDPSMLQRSDPNDPMTWKRDGGISVQYRSHSDGRQRYHFERSIDPSMLQRSDPNDPIPWKRDGGVSIQYRSHSDGRQRYHFERNIDPSMLQRSDPNDPMTWKRDGGISIQYRSNSDGRQRYHFERNIDPSMLQRSDPNDPMTWKRDGGVSIQYRSHSDGRQRYHFERNIDPSMLQRSDPNDPMTWKRDGGISIQYRSNSDGRQRYHFERNIDPSMLQRSDPNDPMTWKRDGGISIQYRSNSDGRQRYHFERNIDPSMLQRNDGAVYMQYNFPPKRRHGSSDEPTNLPVFPSIRGQRDIELQVQEPFGGNGPKGSIRAGAVVFNGNPHNEDGSDEPINLPVFPSIRGQGDLEVQVQEPFGGSAPHGSIRAGALVYRSNPQNQDGSDEPINLPVFPSIRGQGDVELQVQEPFGGNGPHGSIKAGAVVYNGNPDNQYGSDEAVNLPVFPSIRGQRDVELQVQEPFGGSAPHGSIRAGAVVYHSNPQISVGSDGPLRNWYEIIRDRLDAKPAICVPDPDYVVEEESPSFEYFNQHPVYMEDPIKKK